jgi:hypothetical protein
MKRINQRTDAVSKEESRKEGESDMKKLLVLLFFCTVVVFSAAPGAAEVNVSISIPLPGFVFPAPPGLIVVPGTYVYYPPEAGVEIFFYHGYWYRPYNGAWYIANGYNGPWRSVRSVPRPVRALPAGYRGLPPRHDRVPYPEVKKNWKTWERERYWDKTAGRGKDHGRGHGRGHGNSKHGRN